MSKHEHWADSPANLAELWRWLQARDEAPSDVADFLEKPWRFANEWRAMRAEKDGAEATELTAQLEASLPYVRLWRAVRSVRRSANGQR